MLIVYICHKCKISRIYNMLRCRCLDLLTIIRLICDHSRSNINYIRAEISPKIIAMICNWMFRSVVAIMAAEIRSAIFLFNGYYIVSFILLQ